MSYFNPYVLLRFFSAATYVWCYDDGDVETTISIEVTRSDGIEPAI